MYMSPEVLAGQPPSERSDIYALGVLLYQLVVGDFRRPLTAGWENEIDDELLREDIALTACGNPQERLDDAGHIASRLRHLPERRAKRTNEIRDAEQAIALQKRLDRYQQRRPLLIGLATLLITGLAVTGLLAWQLRTALMEARRQTDIATAVNDFMQKDLLAAIDPAQVGKPDPSMREVMKAADQRISQRFADAPLLEGAVRTTLGNVWHLIGDDADAEKDLRRAIAVLEPLGSSARLETARAHLALGRNLSVRGMDEYALHFDRAAALAAQDDDPASWKLGAQVRFARARVHAWSGQAMQALAILDPLWSEITDRLPNDDEFRVKVRVEHISVISSAGRPEDALTAAKQLVPYLERGRARNITDAADLHRVIAQTLHALGRFDEALLQWQRALEQFSTAFGANNGETLRTRMFMAETRIKAGASTQGIAELRALLEPLRQNQGELGFSVHATAILADAVVDHANSAADWQQAERDALAAMSEIKKVSPTVAALQPLANARLAHIYANTGRKTEAAALFANAIPLVKAELEPGNRAAMRALKQYQDFLDAAAVTESAE